MVNRMQFYIDGAWVDPVAKKSTPVVNPATEEAMYEVALGSKADVDKAVIAARCAFETFSVTSREERVALLEKIIAVYKTRIKNIGAAVSDEIQKIGEQTAAILQTAHQQANETTRKAQAEADKCLSDAAANAISMKEEAKQQLRHLDTETDAVWHERSRLIDDVRTVATALFSLAEDATDRFPPEDERRLAGRSSGPVISRMTPSAPAATPSQAQNSESETADQPAVAPEGENSVVDGEDHVRGLDDSGHGGPFLQP